MNSEGGAAYEDCPVKQYILITQFTIHITLTVTYGCELLLSPDLAWLFGVISASYRCRQRKWVRDLSPLEKRTCAQWNLLIGVSKEKILSYNNSPPYVTARWPPLKIPAYILSYLNYLCFWFCFFFFAAFFCVKLLLMHTKILIRNQYIFHCNKHTTYFPLICLKYHKDLAPSLLFASLGKKYGLFLQQKPCHSYLYFIFHYYLFSYRNHPLVEGHLVKHDHHALP